MILKAKSDGTRFTYDVEEMRKCAQNFAGKDVEIEVRKFVRRRSIKQNKSMFGIAYRMIADRLTELHGEKVTTEQVHEIMKEKFQHILYDAPENRVQDLGVISLSDKENLLLPFSTTYFSTIGAMKYYEAMQQWGAQYLEIDIPAPNEEQHETKI